MSWITEYINNVVAEMRKVSWPSRDELISSTLITLVATIIISAFIFIADQVISTSLEVIYQ
jgi:preprotein translocase subunit SecE